MLSYSMLTLVFNVQNYLFVRKYSILLLADKIDYLRDFSTSSFK